MLAAFAAGVAALSLRHAASPRTCRSATNAAPASRRIGSSAASCSTRSRRPRSRRAPGPARWRRSMSGSRLRPASRGTRSTRRRSPAFIGAEGPRWRGLGFGAKQAMLWSGAAGSLRLLLIPAGAGGARARASRPRADAGAFRGLRRRDGAVPGRRPRGRCRGTDHTPRATDEGPCLCLAATDAPLRFRAMIPRILQPIFRI